MQDERLSIGPYVTERADQAAFNRAVKWGVLDIIHGWSTLVFRAMGIVFFGYVVARLSLTQFITVQDFEALRAFPIVAAGLAALFDLLVLRPYFAARVFRMRAERQQTIAITPAAVETIAGDIKSTMPWHEVDRVAVKRNHIFLFLSPVTAIIIPVRVFRSADGAKAFGEKARAWYGTVVAARAT